MHLFSESSIFLSPPFEQNGKWLFLFGDRATYKFRAFETLGDAESEIRTIKCALSLGAGYISSRIYNIETEQAKKITDLSSYCQVVTGAL
jgi:hypothetical protein